MEKQEAARAHEKLAATGIPGLDDILGGGFARGRLFLLEGAPGSGKTTLALQFLIEGARRGESVLYVTLSESREELDAVAESHGWELDGIEVRELNTAPPSFDTDHQYTMFHPSEVELAETLKAIALDAERVKPARVVFDSLSELRLLAGSPLQYRRQILALKQYFGKRKATLLLLDDQTAPDPDGQVQSIAHGIVQLEQLQPEYGAARRRLSVLKYRGHAFRGGFHDYVIARGGLQVFPRLVAAESRAETTRRVLSTGVPAMDKLLGGGLSEGSSTLLLGAAGTGKSNIVAQIVTSAAEVGLSGAMYVFDESISMALDRAEGLGVPLREHIDARRIHAQQVDPAELSPGQFSHEIRRDVEQRGVKVIVIDSLNGYLNAMPGERYLIVQLHELLAYLSQRGVVTILVATQQGLIGSNMQSVIDASYLADTVILLRYFEARGEVRQAMSVLKRRSGPHERTIREFSFGKDGISIGEPLREYRGVLTGVPFSTGQDPASERHRA